MLKKWGHHTVVALLLGCTSREVDRPQIAASSGLLIRCHNIQTQFSEDGLLSVRLEAPLQEELRSGDVQFSKGISITHYDSYGERKAKLVADSAFFFHKEGIYEARGKVFLKNIETDSDLRTEKLIWNPKTQRIYTNTKVRIRNKNEIHKGEGLNASEDFKDYHILRPSGTLEVNESKLE